MATPEPINERGSENGALAVSAGWLPKGLNVPPPTEYSTPARYAEVLGEVYLASAEQGHRRDAGHYQTPVTVARFMAGCCAYSIPHLRVLDPGSGAGILSASVCEAASNGGTVGSIHVDAYETDSVLAKLTHLVLAFSREWLAQRGIVLTFDVKQEDFVLAHSSILESKSKPSLFVNPLDGSQGRYDLVVSNPPYFKINKEDPRAVAGASVVHGQPNIYALFMAISAELLSEAGQLVYIVPRSFASGQYFKEFRKVFFQRVAPTAVHLFESRKDVFKTQTVLQESLVIAARSRPEGEAPHAGQVLVSHSKAAHDIDERRRFYVGLESVIDLASKQKELFLPLSTDDLTLAEAVRSWPNTLHSLGLDASTGPVVPFRSARFLAQASVGQTVPLLWMHHVRPMQAGWPLDSTGKPQWIRKTRESMKLLVADETYVLVRRFSAKEEKRRLVAAPLAQGQLNADMVGLENHLNYIRGVSRKLDGELAHGLAALLNSVFLDRYFRLSNGNTQVSATELRCIPLPGEEHIRAIGSRVQSQRSFGTSPPELDGLVAKALDLPLGLCIGQGPAAV